VGIFTIYRQLQYLKNAKLGFESRNIIVIPMIDTAFNKNYFSFKNELLFHSEIENVSAASGLPGFNNYMDIMHFEGKQQMEEQVVTFYESDFHFVDLMKFDLIKGRNFNPEFSTEVTQSAIINKALAEKFGWGNDAIGKKIERGFGSKQKYQVVGVVDNFNFNSLREEVSPVVMFLTGSPYGYLLIRLREATDTEAIKAISKLWAEFCPSVPFDFLRLDTTLLQNYDSEGNLLNIIIYFTVLTLFIALLGLFSFSLFVTEKFTREIGIRKAFGASSADIFRLLISKFALLVILSNIFAWPVAEIIVRDWLDGFAYKVNLSWLTFILASAAALAIAMITVSIQTFRTASKRPVDILKYE
jgi:ABC-type antimicrobial peptide transport system permease subunit